MRKGEGSVSIWCFRTQAASEKFARLFAEPRKSENRAAEVRGAVLGMCTDYRMDGARVRSLHVVVVGRGCDWRWCRRGSFRRGHGWRGLGAWLEVELDAAVGLRALG